MLAQAGGVRCISMEKDSFAVRCFFLWDKRSDQEKRFLYEERITVWRAEKLDRAIALAESEAREYASDDSTFLDFSQGYAMFDRCSESGIEVYSLLRESDLEAEEYLNTFFDTGHERQEETN